MGISLIFFFCFFHAYQVSDANAELVKLGNQVALLEEEKGNLQLSLVDFDELKGRNQGGNIVVPSLSIDLFILLESLLLKIALIVRYFV